MAQALADALSPSELQQQQDDALAFEHVESFNILCVGESGLGKSTFLRDIFAHLDPTKQLVYAKLGKQPGFVPTSLRQLLEAAGGKKQ